MLRPAVAIANNARAGKTRGLDIGRWRPSLKKTSDAAMQGVTGPPKCPSGGRPSTRVRKQRYRWGREQVFEVTKGYVSRPRSTVLPPAPPTRDPPECPT